MGITTYIEFCIGYKNEILLLIKTSLQIPNVYDHYADVPSGSYMWQYLHPKTIRERSRYIFFTYCSCLPGLNSLTWSLKKRATQCTEAPASAGSGKGSHHLVYCTQPYPVFIQEVVSRT